MKCYQCGGTEYGIIAEKEDIRFGCYGHDKKVVKCFRCDLVQLFPQWTQEELDKLYSEYSKKEDFKGQKRKVKISKYLTKYARKQDNILEVGCGQGDNLVYLRQKGFNVTGIDKELNYAWEDYPGDRKWDMIYAIHLLEHLPDPLDFIRWMLRTLTKTGRFVLEVPSINDPLLGLKAFQKFYWYPYHLFFYSKKTVRELFRWCPSLKLSVHLRQEYGILNHLRWLFLGRPGNLNFHIPVLDDIYKFILIRCGFGDTLVVVGERCSI